MVPGMSLIFRVWLLLWRVCHMGHRARPVCRRLLELDEWVAMGHLGARSNPVPLALLGMLEVRRVSLSQRPTMTHQLVKVQGKHCFQSCLH